MNTRFGALATIALASMVTIGSAQAAQKAPQHDQVATTTVQTTTVQTTKSDAAVQKPDNAAAYSASAYSGFR